MATLVLTVVGGLVGGPIGAAIGSTVGQVIDRNVLFRPKGREGPRLTNLAVQTSSYGTAIPAVFGRMRIGGSVIWATELIENRSTGRAGKGQPTTTTYSYSSSFAVALSSRPISDVGRIWADGKLLRGAAGDFKTQTGFRLHKGDEGQAADPLIVAAEGAGGTPAYRGIAYAVFEDFQLAEYGNRIPQLTFEVIADTGTSDGLIDAATIAVTLDSDRVIAEPTATRLTGFAATGDVPAALEVIAGASGGWFRPADGPRLSLVTATTAPPPIIVSDAGYRAGRTADSGRRVAASGQRRLTPLTRVPVAVSLNHYDPDRDFQTGMQRARRPGPGEREVRIELPAAADAATARAIAMRMLLQAELGRERRMLALPPSALGTRPGDLLQISGVGGTWRITRWALTNMVVEIDCVRTGDASVAAGASPGRVLAAPDLEAGETLIELFELPVLDDTPLSTPRVMIAAAGTRPGWRRAALLQSLDDGARWTPAGPTAVPAILGQIAAMSLLPGASAAIFDTQSSIDIELAHADMALSGADDDALIAGNNLALLGDELIQFGQAEQLTPTRWRLRRLLRGRRGTEQAIGAQAIGARFILIEPDALAFVDVPLSQIGATMRVLASGIGDGGGPVEAACTVTGQSVAPPAPVHLSAQAGDAGDLVVRWTRRSRTGWRWADGIETPLGEESEAYSVSIAPEGLAARSIVTGMPQTEISAAESAGRRVTVAIRQAGTHALSPASELTIPAG